MNFEKNLCEALIQIKKENPNTYLKALNVLTFIYKDIKKDFIYNGHSHGEDPSLSLQELEQNIISQITESENGIINNLLDMCQNDDKRFQESFFNAIEVPIDMLRNNIYSSTRNYLYIMNIYTMLQAYQANKDNYENYEAILDDISLLFIDDRNYFISALNPIKTIKELIDKFVSNQGYKDIKDLRIYFKKYFKNLTREINPKDYERLTEMFQMYKEFYNHLNNENRNTRKVSKDLEKEISNDISLLIHPDLLPGVYPYYSRILIYNNRYKYFKEKIKVVNPHYRKEVFDTIKKLNIGIFADLNKDKEEDSFETYMDILFDSDTNTELYSKMKMLCMASDKYSSGDREGAILTLKQLDSKINKAKFGGIVISYPKDENINKKEKPKTIDKRMEELYRENDLISAEFDISKERSSLSEFNNQIFMEMTNYSTSKFARQQNFERETNYTIATSEEPPKPIEKKIGMFGIKRNKR